ncbi:MAG: S9 family peptidase, partial [Anaerolineae bacterium]|nr:S9 family peptidase [Anaerolineae bacterium]
MERSMASRKLRTITAEDLYLFNTVSEVRISPDGQHVVYTVQRVERKTEKKFTNLWVVPTLGGKAWQFTTGDQHDGSGRWSPDGKRIAFLSDRGDKEKPAQIYLIPFTGGEANRLTQIEGEIEAMSWSPDGKHILCTVRKKDAEAVEREKDEQKKKLGVVARHYDRLFYKLDGYGYLPHERTHVWVVDALTGKARQLTESAVYDEFHPTWSPDGKWIAFTSNRSENPDLTPERTDLYVMPRSGGDFRKIETPIGDKYLPSFSPDGKWIAYLGVEGEGLSYKNVSLWVVATDGLSAARNLTEKYDIHADSSSINDVGSPETMPPTWSKDGKRLYFNAVLHGSAKLASISVTGKDLRDEIGEGGVVGSFSFDKAQRTLAYFYGRVNDPVQIFGRDMVSGKERQLTQLNRKLLDGIDLGQVEEVWFKGPDSNDLQAWILKPPGFDPTKRYPSIMEIHGGPLTQYGKFFMHEFYYLAAHGYVVYFTNPRGGRGYGEAHAKGIYGDWGGVDYADLMAWADYMEKQPYIDPKRMGVTGGSYGGYMTVWIIGHTQRFKAAVSQRCVSNFVSMWGSSDFNWNFQTELGNKPPFEDLQNFWTHSPIAHIGNAQTPTLVIHNEGDLRCPIEQSEQVFVALKKLGVESEFVRFPDEFHGLSRTGRTDRRMARLNHILRWFDKYL